MAEIVIAAALIVRDDGETLLMRNAAQRRFCRAARSSRAKRRRWPRAGIGGGT